MNINYQRSANSKIVFIDSRMDKLHFLIDFIDFVYMSEMEEIDNEILNEIQWTFPLVS